MEFKGTKGKWYNDVKCEGTVYADINGKPTEIIQCWSLITEKEEVVSELDCLYNGILVANSVDLFNILSEILTFLKESKQNENTLIQKIETLLTQATEIL